MDSLKRLRDEEIRSTLHREIDKQLHVMYDPVAKDELPLKSWWTASLSDFTNSTEA
jgi:hypothetical protein